VIISGRTPLRISIVTSMFNNPTGVGRPTSAGWRERAATRHGATDEVAADDCHSRNEAGNHE
jgi:hypothetical protein